MLKNIVSILHDYKIREFNFIRKKLNLYRRDIDAEHHNANSIIETVLRKGFYFPYRFTSVILQQN